MAEDLTDYLRELGVKVQYLHSEVDTLDRVQILRDLRLGVYDVIVGINLLREGIDLPEVTLVAILDADKEGFLRSAWSLIQMIGRAARNIGGEVVMYADVMTESMQAAIEETDRRRAIQERYNVENGITPITIVKEIHDINDRLRVAAEVERAVRGRRVAGAISRGRRRCQVEQLVARLEAEMRSAARKLEFERAAAMRDEIQEIRLRVLAEDASVIVGRAAEAAGRPAGRIPRRAARARAGGRAGSAGRPGSRRRGGRQRSALEVTGGDRDRARRRGARRSRGDRRRLAARPPRRARGRRRRLAGPLARPANLGPHGHAERQRRTGRRDPAPLTLCAGTGGARGRRPIGRTPVRN